MFNFFKRDNARVINVNDIDNLLGKVELIDIREDYEFKRGTLKSAKNIPMGQLLDNPDKYLDKNKEYYIMCQSGGRSQRTCTSLTKKGFNVINVSGGVGSYLGTNKQ